MQGNSPKFRFKTRGGDGKYVEIGTAWATATEGVFSVKLKLPDGTEMSAIMVPGNGVRQAVPTSTPQARKPPPRKAPGTSPAKDDAVPW